MFEPDFAFARRRADTGHISGEGNVAADAASRAQRERLFCLTRQLRIHLVKLPVPASCAALYGSVLWHAACSGNDQLRLSSDSSANDVKI